MTGLMMKRIVFPLLFLLTLLQAVQMQAETRELWIDNGSRHIYGELFTPPDAR